MATKLKKHTNNVKFADDEDTGNKRKAIMPAFVEGKKKIERFTEFEIGLDTDKKKEVAIQDSTDFFFIYIKNYQSILAKGNV